MHMKNALIGCYNVIPIEDKVILIKEKNVWSLPSGKLEFGETLKDCATREALEECGLSVTPGDILGVYQTPELRGTNVINFAFVSNLNDKNTFVETELVKAYSHDDIQHLIRNSLIRDNIHVTIVNDYYSTTAHSRDLIKRISA